VRNGNVFTPYLNGTAGTATTSSDALFDFTSEIRIGSDSSTSPTPFQGYMDDVRITKGVARYTSNFTPPTESFPGFTYTPGKLVLKKDSVAAPLLDLYPGADAAYSLRSLTTGTERNVVRVRRSSDSTEQDFTASQVTDGTLTTFCGANDGFVHTWYDQSGNSKHVTQTNATKQPRIVNSGSIETEGTKPSINFDGSNDFLQVLNTDFAAPSGLSIYSAANISAGRIIDKYSGDPPRRFWTVINTGTLLEDSHTGAFDATAAATHLPSTGFLLRSFVWNSSNFLQTHTNGILTGTATSLQSSYSYTAGLVSPVGVGADLDGVSQFANGKILEVIAYGARHVAERTAIESNINAHYAIY
jgi:hypothetical protein